MNFPFEPGNPNGTCEGCLSSDRILSELNQEFKKVYSCYVQENVVECASPLLCWECIANIRKFLIFKRKCLQASYLLSKYRISSTQISSLSTITVFKTSLYTNIRCTGEETYIDYKSQNEDVKQRNINYNLNHNNDVLNVIPKNVVELATEGQDSKVEIDINVVKVEEDFLEDLEGCFVDDGFSYQDEGDSKDVNTAIHNKDGSHKTKVKRKRVRKKKPDEEFDCSDEEPLYNKKRSKSLSVKKQKKSNENGDSKLGKQRREAPAGVVNHPRVMKKLRQLNVPDGLIEMVVLTWEQVEEERQMAVKSEVFTRHMYRCQNCIVGFNHRHKLDNHMKKHDPMAGELLCEVCTVRFKDNHALSAHRRRHRLRWRCSACGALWSRASVAADHAARLHSAPRPTHACSLCGHEEATLGKLRNHLKNHSERQKCELCGKTFRDRTSLRTHLFIHKGEKEYSCPKCEKKFLFKKAMEIHLVTHEESAHLYCYECDVNFKNSMSYTQHMKYSLKHIHPDMLKYACSLCDKKFAKANRLREHHIALHLKATPVQCPEPGCNFACSSRAVLRTHARMVHRLARALRNHVCHSCGRSYTTKKALEGHIRSHTGERPFKCGVCPSTFGYEAALYNHNKLVHLKDKTNKRSHPLPVEVQDTGTPIET